MGIGESYELLEQYRAGESEAATAIFERYVDRLVALARKRLSGKLSRRVDPEDVAQSAFRSFFLHAREGEYELRHTGDLWRLLAQIAIHKLHRQVDRHHAKRRAIGRDAGSEGVAAAQVLEPGPAEVVALVEQLHRILADLGDEPRNVLMATLRGEDVEQIATAMKKSPRSVRRYLAESRERIERELSGESQQRNESIVRSIPVIDDALFVRSEDYSLEQMLGAGGMGKVYRGLERPTGRTVAVKALRKLRQGDPRAVDQFVQEAKILATLRHPNIVKLHGIGTFPGGGLFIVMDYVAGGNLEEQLRKKRFGEREALTMIRLVGEAIAHANDRGIVHADLKPANVLLDPDGRTIVSDFGFARIVVADKPFRKSLVGGTAGYMAPEVHRLGEEPTVAADIYALGAMLWAVVTGRRPTGEEVNADFSDVPPSIARICRRCLVEQPVERFRTVRELLVELDRALAVC
jgi:eukaryotic-like serine/threonine-protein kinase